MNLSLLPYTEIRPEKFAPRARATEPARVTGRKPQFMTGQVSAT